MRAVRQLTREQISLSDVLYALSDPARIEIVLCLAETGERACNQSGVEMPKSSLSHHFKVLRDAGIIATRADGTRHINSLRTADLNARFPGLLASVLKAARNSESDVRATNGREEA